MPTVESWADPVRLKPKPKRRGAEEARAEMEAMASSKRRRVGDLPNIHEEDAAEPEAAGGEDGEQQEAARGEGDRRELEQKEVPLPVRIAQAKSNSSNRKTSSRGKKKVADPRQQLIKKFFQVKDAEENGKLESSDRLNLEADNAGLGGAAAGVDPELQAGPSGESERRNCQKRTKTNL